MIGNNQISFILVQEWSYVWYDASLRKTCFVAKKFQQTYFYSFMPNETIGLSRWLQILLFLCELKVILCRTSFYTDIPNLQRVLLKIRRTFKIRDVVDVCSANRYLVVCWSLTYFDWYIENLSELNSHLFWVELTRNCSIWPPVKPMDDEEVFESDVSWCLYKVL